MNKLFDISTRLLFGMSFIALFALISVPAAIGMSVASTALYIGDESASLDTFIRWLTSKPAAQNPYIDNSVGSITNPLITEETVRMEYKLAANSTSIVFNPNESKTASQIRPYEKLLESTCTFWPVYISLGFQKENYITATAAHDDSETCQNDRPIFTYPDPAYFNHSLDSGEKEYRELQRIWNSCMSLKTGTSTRMENFDLSKTMFNPGCCQFEPAAEGGTPKFPLYGPSYGERGFHKLRIPFPLYGGISNEFRIELPKGLSTASVGDVDECDVKSCNVAVLRLCGYKFRGNADDACIF